MYGIIHANSFFSESGHVACQFRGNEVYNNMLAKILPLQTHSTPGICGQKVRNFFFLKAVILHIKLKRMKHRTK